MKSFDEDFEKLLLKIKNNALTRKNFDFRRWQMDMALKQEFLDNGLQSGSYKDYNLSEDDVKTLIEDDGDAYSDLYNPLLLKYFKSYLVNITNICFPANGDWVDIKREYSDYFYKTGLEDFLQYVNDGWINVLKTENQRFGIKSKYKSSLAEFVSYGITVLSHQYNAQDHYVEVITPGIGTAGIWPITNDWRKSNICFYYDVDYSLLTARQDLDQEILSSIMPSETEVEGINGGTMGSTRIQEMRENVVPFGKVRCYDFFLPSVFYKTKNGEYISESNVYVTALIKPKLKDGAKLPQKEIYILKMSLDIDPLDHGILFGTFNTNLPNVFYSQGALMPFLPHQYIANQFFSEISRSVGMVTDPARTVTGINGMMLDPMEVPTEPLAAGGLYENVEMKQIVDSNSISTNLQVFLAYMDWFERTLESGLGVSKNQTGTLHLGRKTATEVKEAYSGGQLTMVDTAANYDDDILRPSDFIRLSKTQKILREQFDTAVAAEAEANPAMSEEIYEEILSQNPLFRRVLNYMGIQPLYEEYYKRKMLDLIQDQKIAAEVQKMVAEGHQMIAFADSPIPPMPNIPQAKDPVSGEMIPTLEEINGLKREWFQGQSQQRTEARDRAQQLLLEVEEKKLTFKDVKEPPPPSLKLYYDMIVAPVLDSDIVVTGAMTTVSKELARQNLLMLVNALPQFPGGTVSKVDFNSILMMLARANDIPVRDLMKDTATIAREEDAQAKQQEFERQMVMQAAQGKPGAQPPTIPPGASI